LYYGKAVTYPVSIDIFIRSSLNIVDTGFFNLIQFLPEATHYSDSGLNIKCEVQFSFPEITFFEIY
jgi:hypothetical protein